MSMQKLTEQEIVRREKLKEIAKVCNPYPDSFKRTHTLKEAKNLSDGTTDVSICGRIIFMRKMGKLSFVRIRELESDLQLEFRIDEVGEEKYDFFKKLIDSGDFIGATGCKTICFIPIRLHLLNSSFKKLIANSCFTESLLAGLTIYGA